MSSQYKTTGASPTVCAGVWRSPVITDLFDIFTGDGFTCTIHRSLCNNDDVQPGAAASLLRGTEKNFKIHKHNTRPGGGTVQEQTCDPPPAASCTGDPPILPLEASLG